MALKVARCRFMAPSQTLQLFGLNPFCRPSDTFVFGRRAGSKFHATPFSLGQTGRQTLAGMYGATSMLKFDFHSNLTLIKQKSNMNSWM